MASPAEPERNFIVERAHKANRNTALLCVSLAAFQPICHGILMLVSYRYRNSDHITRSDMRERITALLHAFSTTYCAAQVLSGRDASHNYAGFRWQLDLEVAYYLVDTFLQTPPLYHHRRSSFWLLTLHHCFFGGMFWWYREKVWNVRVAPKGAFLVGVLYAMNITNIFKQISYFVPRSWSRLHRLSFLAYVAAFICFRVGVWPVAFHLCQWPIPWHCYYGSSLVIILNIVWGFGLLKKALSKRGNSLLHQVAPA